MISPTPSSGTSGQTMSSASAIRQSARKANVAAKSTKARIVKPIARLTMLSPNARILASKPAPGYVMIRRHGENSVRSRILIENISLKEVIRRTVLLSTPAQPGPYHHANRSSIIIVIVIVASIKQPRKSRLFYVAEREGFEPSIPFRVNPRSRRAP
jgi:hypothetical protein